MKSGERALLAPWIWVVYVGLFIVAIPWYWPSGDERVFLGFPLWVVVSIAMSLVISIYTAWIFLTRWPRQEDE
ncbi:MAG: hypothetical protein AAGC68_07290 [Verrucomicrobiota bacterium]